MSVTGNSKLIKRLKQCYNALWAKVSRADFSEKEKARVSWENKNDHKNIASVKSDKTQYDTDTDK